MVRLAFRVLGQTVPCGICARVERQCRCSVLKSLQQLCEEWTGEDGKLEGKWPGGCCCGLAGGRLRQGSWRETALSLGGMHGAHLEAGT